MMLRSVKQNAVLLLMLCVLGMAACKKNKPGSDGAAVDLIITPKGQPMGSAVTKSIGAGGGSLTSADGTLTVTIPAGTVATNTEFSIQPISNTLDARKSAFRLFPEGVTFLKPVELTYKYADADIAGTAEDLLMLFYQTEQGSWKRMDTEIDKTQKQLKVSTTHFSDWVANGAFTLAITKESLLAGETTKVRVLGVFESDDDILTPLTEASQNFAGVVKKIGNWKVLQGSGTIVGKPAGSNPAIMQDAVYSAPASVPASETVTIQVEIEGNIRYGGRGPALQKVILLDEIRLVSDMFMLVDLGGTTLIGEVSAEFGNGTILIGATRPEMIVVMRANANSAGNYPCGGLFDAGKSLITVSVDPVSANNRIYLSTYRECGPPLIDRYSSGIFRITKWGPVGETVEGEFNGTMYTEENPTGSCPQYSQKNLRIKFRTIRTQ